MTFVDDQKYVSIPQWYDYYKTASHLPRCLRYVSIPQWYDYYSSAKSFCSRTSGFNSSMVRLLPQYPDFECCICIRFNSSMVRLLHAHGYRAVSVFILFQFLNGTIITIRAGACIKMLPRFNSSMVRLLLHTFLASEEGLIGFNSSMVRLLLNSCGDIAYNGLFQFLNGTIIT